MNQSDKNELLISREFAAPRSLVFEAFTKKEHLQHWWGPAGFSIEVLELDLKINGKFHYKMKSPDGHEMFGIFHYKEISYPEKIVFSNAFADQEGNIIPAPVEGGFPKQIINTCTFSEQNGKTLFTLHSMPYNANEVEQAGFNALNENMNEGYTQTFNQLDNYLRTRLKLYSLQKTNKTARVSTYLNFPGNTEAAFNFYKTVFKTEFSGRGIQRFKDVGMPEGAPPLSEEHQNLIIHVELPITGGHLIMATDAPESMGFKLSPGNNMFINLEPETKEETKLLFEALSEGGNITMPLELMFWGAYFGSCTDKFGVNWMFNFTEQTN